VKIAHRAVERRAQSGQDFWQITMTITADDGTSSESVCLMPSDTMEWRAAEYGIDPADTATLADIVLAEPFLTADDWSAGTHLYGGSPGLTRAPDIDTARADHIARCAQVKWRHRMSTRVKTNPVVRVRDESPLHPDVISIKAGLVAGQRAHHAEQDLRAATVTSEDDRVSGWKRRAEELRQARTPRPKRGG